MQRVARTLHLALFGGAAQLVGEFVALRRRLRDEGQGYQAIKDNLRRAAAIEYLSQPELTLADIAGRLGFSEASTFHRAFKGWTGLSPGAYRQTQLHPL